MKSRIKDNEKQVANVTTELLQAKEQLETGSSKTKRAPRGAIAKQLKELEEQRDVWKKAFEEPNTSKKGGQALDECNAKVKELQKELAKEHQQRMELEKKAKALEQKQSKEPKMPAKEHRGPTSVSHPP